MTCNFNKIQIMQETESNETQPLILIYVCQKKHSFTSASTSKALAEDMPPLLLKVEGKKSKNIAISKQRDTNSNMKQAVELDIFFYSMQYHDPLFHLI